MLETDHDDLTFCRRVGLLVVGYEVDTQTVFTRGVHLAAVLIIKGKLAWYNGVRPLDLSYAAAGFEGVIRECEADIHLFRQGRRSHDNSLKRPELPHGVDSLFCTFGDNDGSSGLILRLDCVTGVRPAEKVIPVTRRNLSDGYFIFNVEYLPVAVRAIVEVIVQNICHTRGSFFRRGSIGCICGMRGVRAAGVFDSMYFLDIIRGFRGIVRSISVVRVTRSIVRVVRGYDFFAGTRLCALGAADGAVIVYGFLCACFGADAHGCFRLPFLGQRRYREKRQRHADKQQDTEQSSLHSRFPFDVVGGVDRVGVRTSIIT